MPDPHIYNEKELLQRIAEGDEQAFRELFVFYSPQIYSYVFRLTSSSFLADEAVQEIFLKVWLNQQKLPGITNFYGWLLTVARNHAFDLLKKMAKEKKEQASIEDSPLISHVEEDLFSKENIARLAAVIQNLPPQQRLIFKMSREDGLKYEDIAMRLAISRHTVKAHIAQAIRTIRRELNLPSNTLIIILASFFLPG